MFLSAILEMCLLSIISILKTCMRRLSHTYSLFYSVNKPTLQLSALDCPLWYTIYLFSGVVTPLLCLFFSHHSLFSNSLSHINPFIPTDGHIPAAAIFERHLDNTVKCFRFIVIDSKRFGLRFRSLIQYSHQYVGR